MLFFPIFGAVQTGIHGADQLVNIITNPPFAAKYGEKVIFLTEDCQKNMN